MAAKPSSENMDRLRSDMRDAFLAARNRAAKRLGVDMSGPLADSRARSRRLLDASQERARRLLGLQNGEPSPLTCADLHTLDRLLSYVRHSVVRVCFYNLKLFCPSLVDEYDEDVRQEVIANIDQLGAARKEIEQFFAQELSNGVPAGATFPQNQQSAERALNALLKLAERTRDQLDHELARKSFAERAPGHIDAVMNALSAVQLALDAHKVALGDLVEQAVTLSRDEVEAAGIQISVKTEPTPKVYADKPALLNCFIELIANAVKYSGGSALTACVQPVSRNGPWAEIAFEDDGRGMTADELASCVTRGVSRSGSGEGLAMIVEVVEGEHLGEFEISAEPGRGCRAVIRLPVKLDARPNRNRGNAP